MIDFNFSLNCIELYLIFVNIVTFLIYGFDKLQAFKNNRDVSRVPEVRLLLLILLGGVVGALIAMILFRHKIKKLSFMVKFIVLVILQVIFFYFGSDVYDLIINF